MPILCSKGERSKSRDVKKITHANDDIDNDTGNNDTARIH